MLQSQRVDNRHYAWYVLSQYKRIRELQRKSRIHYFYEATVGAGLPIISTLRSLVETGDKIVKVEGVFRLVIRRARTFVILNSQLEMKKFQVSGCSSLVIKTSKM